MDSRMIFSHIVPELEILPEQPVVLWYPSSGTSDFRPAVFFSNYHISQINQNRNQNLKKPDLLLYNSLGSDVKVLRNKLQKGNTILYKDHSTTVIGSNCKQLHRDISKFRFRINPKYVELSNVLVPRLGYEAFLFSITISGTHGSYQESIPILFFEAENINIFNTIILSNIFNIKYFINTREGCGFGGCNFPMVRYIYQNHNLDFYSDLGYTPEYCVVFQDFTDDIFRNAIDAVDFVDFQDTQIEYIREDIFRKDSSIYRLNYHI